MTRSSVLDLLRAQSAGEQEAPASKREPASGPLIGAYARISDAYEKEFGGVTEHGVKRQLDIARNIAETRGWVIHDEYVDNSVSAFKTNVVRESFEDLLTDLDAGVIDGIVCYDLDRFVRQVTDLERAIRIYDDARKRDRVLYFATAQGDLNLASDDGLTMARVMVAFANKASRDTARRVAVKHQEMRNQGKSVGGRRPFGWDWSFEDKDGNPAPRRHVLNPAEADAIRWAAEGLTEGRLTWRAAVAEWNARGLLTPTGKEWVPTTLKAVMGSPRLAGWLVHKGSIARHSRTGELIRSGSEPILTDDEFMALLVAVEGRGGGRSQQSGMAKYLLAGIVRCAECGARMRGNAHRDGRFYYVCQRSERNGDGTSAACGSVSCSGLGLDDLVTKLVLPRIIEETRGLLNSTVPKPNDPEILDLEAQKDRLLAAVREDRTVAEAALPAVSSIQRDLDALRHEQAVWVRTQRMVVRRGAAVTEENWGDLTTEEKRTHVARHIETIYVSKATRPTGRVFDAERVAPPVWRTPGARVGLRAVAPR